jgi:hypothetical protein
MLLTQNLNEIINFLSKQFCSDFNEQFQGSLSNLMKNIDKLSFEQFLQFHNFVLVSMFSSKELTIPDEDFMLYLLIEMINRDPNRKILLKVIHFPFISSHLLINFLQDYSIDDLDSDFFERLKQRIFCEIAKSTTEIPSGRWIQNWHCISRKDIEDIFSILLEHDQENENLLDQIKKLIEKNELIKSQNQKLQSQIESLQSDNAKLKNQLSSVQNENAEMKKQLTSSQKEILDLTHQISSLQAQNKLLKENLVSKENQNLELQSTISELNSTISIFKSILDSYPIAPLDKFSKNNQNKPILLKSLIWKYNQDPIQHFKQEMLSLNQKIEHQFTKSFPFEFSIEQTKVQLSFPLYFDNHEGLFFHLTRSYSLVQLSDIILIETSSDGNPFNFPKENVLSWGSPSWFSNDLPNSTITFTLLSGEFSIEGYRICGRLQYQPIDFILEGKEKDGEWIEIDKRLDELMKTAFQNPFYSEHLLNVREKEFFNLFF